MKPIRFAALFVAVVTSSCTTVTTSHVMTGRAGKASATLPKVYMQGKPVPESAVEVAIVQTSARGLDVGLPDVIGGLQERAASLGCDAIVHVQVDQGNNQSSGTGVCVRLGGGADEKNDDRATPEAPSCKPEDDPRWGTATAAEKRAIMRKCRGGD